MDFSFLGAGRRSHVTPWAGVVFGIVVGAALGFIVFRCYSDFAPGASMIAYRVSPKVEAVSLVSSSQQSFVDSAFRSAVSYKVDSGARILLIPHHLVAAREIASALASMPAPKRVILLAPDHLGVGKTPVTVGSGAIDFNGERIVSDSRIANDLLSAEPRARGDEAAIAREISMQALIPFVAKAFPKATITPVLMQIGRDGDVRGGISSALTEILKKDRDALLISSVDFSHYLPECVADFHDLLAADVIRGLADLETDRVELDSPGVLSVTLRVARSLGLGDVSVHAHTNSLGILQAKLSQESTSHFIATFAPGKIRPQQRVTMLFLGDMMFDREVENRMLRSKNAIYPFEKLMGTEERMFRGQDAVVGNLEGPMTSTYRAPEKENDFAFDKRVGELLKRVGISIVSQANNHVLDQGREGAEESRRNLEAAGIVWMGDQVSGDPDVSLKIVSMRGQSVAMIGLNAVGIQFDRNGAEEALKRAATSSYQVAYIHWGNEYEAKPTAQQIEIGHWLIDHGVDAVIGSHPHWMQSVEVYRNKPIVYSLGNAVFDQDWSAETQYGLMAGLSLDPDAFQVHLFPIRLDKSEPILLTGDARQSRLDGLAEISDPSLSEQIKMGVVGK